MTKSVPTVFLSYSHDTVEHKQWILDLATRLMHSGINIILDVWEVGLGDDLGHFMETQLVKADRVIMVCTDKYVTKANNGAGGVGYEKMIITSALMQSITDNKVIPVIRQNGAINKPTFLNTKLHVDFSKDDDFEVVIDDLIREIHQEPLFKKPEIGSNPFLSAVEKPADKKHDLKIEILKILVQQYEQNTNLVHDTDLIGGLNISRIIYDIHKAQLIKEGYCKGGRTYRAYTNSYENGLAITDKAKEFSIQQCWVE